MHPSSDNLNLKVLKKDMSPRAVLRKNPSRYPIKKTNNEAIKTFEDLPQERKPKRKEAIYQMKGSLVKKSQNNDAIKSGKVFTTLNIHTNQYTANNSHEKTENTMIL
jgi:hypothetical protein